MRPKDEGGWRVAGGGWREAGGERRGMPQGKEKVLCGQPTQLEQDAWP